MEYIPLLSWVRTRVGVPDGLCISPLVQAQSASALDKDSVAQQEGQNFSDLALFAGESSSPEGRSPEVECILESKGAGRSKDGQGRARTDASAKQESYAILYWRRVIRLREAFPCLLAGMIGSARSARR